MTVHPGRFSAKLEGDFVVFIIGMGVNRPLQVRKWLPVSTAMPRMIRALERAPDSGFPPAARGIGSIGPSLVQYWRSFEHPERYARAADKGHLPAWRRFNQAVRGSGEV